ncbi:MAG TPA: protein phosphatase 2C domain-containing protein [Gemmatimonadaceae bacterium]|nr:protein phosphatase 2C domain-containing protein [Gemmatimonadaceae bacterium]
MGTEDTTMSGAIENMSTGQQTTTVSADAGPRPLDSEVDVYGLTHPGIVRPNNEDHFLICALQKKLEIYHTSLPNLNHLAGKERIAFLSMVADGVGGAVAGEEASRLALEGVTRYVTQALHCYYTTDPTDDTTFMHTLEDAALKVHNELAELASEDRALRGMATTLTMWLGVWPRAYLLQVGDSRCYVLHGSDLVQISRDQTMAEELVQQGVFTRTDAERSRFANVLSSAIGGPQAAPVVRRMDQRWGQVGLLCSDGLTRHVSDDRIRDRLVAMKSAREGCETLLQDALDAGGRDNITIIIGRTAKAPEGSDPATF